MFKRYCVSKKTLWVSCVGVQVVLQQEELSLLDRKMEQWRKEEEVMRVSVEKHRQGLLDVLRQGEEDAQLLHQRIQVFHIHKILVQ